MFLNKGFSKTKIGFNTQKKKNNLVSLFFGSIKRLFLMFFLMFFLFNGNAFAQDVTKDEIPVDSRFSPEFANKLKAAHININDLPTKSEISRYELSRILNLVECWDCLEPGGWMTARYTLPYWDNFVQLPGKDFRDINFQGGVFKDKSYYHCVAYVGDEEYMRGYPVQTSPICAGDFCGEKSVTKAEFIQVVINILEKYSFKDYSANRTKIYDWAKNLEPGKYQYKSLTDEDRNTLSIAANSCKNNTICPLSSRYEFETYLRYCMFNLNECGFQPFGWIKQSYRPVSELNVMKKEGLIPLNDHPENDIHQPVDGNYVLQVIGELHKRIDCSFVLDYDCDDVENRDDNCPDDYNPHQYDFDGDGKGNVCDEDIDDGGMTHPLGIVDDNNIIVTEKRSPNLEGNLFDPNDDNLESDLNDLNNASGNSLSDPITLDIQTFLLQDKNYRLQASIDGKWETLYWNFGDGESGTGEITEHTYLEEGTYLITATAKYKETSATAKATIVISRKILKKAGLYLQSELDNIVLPLALNVKGKSLVIPAEAGAQSSWIQKRYINGQEKTQKEDFFQTIIEKEGLYSVISTLNDDNGKLVATSQGTVDTNFLGQRAVFLNTDKLEGEVGGDFNFQTQNIGFDLEDVSSIFWDFGDGEEENTVFDISYQFSEPGLKVILQRIVLKDGTQYATNLTLYVNPPSQSDISFTKEANGNISNQNEKKANLSIKQKIKDVGEEMEFKLSFKGVDYDNIKKIIIDFGDGETQKIEKANFINNMVLKHTYDALGYVYPKFTILGKDCINMSSQATIYIKGNQDKCLTGKQNGTLMQDFHCDMDGDGTPDICDGDIDGDGKPNQMGLILFENDDCSLQVGDIILKQGNNGLNKDEYGNIVLGDSELLDNTDEIQKENLNNQPVYTTKNNVSQKLGNELNICSLDPCVFISNTINENPENDSNFFDEDLNNNGICDLCEGLSAISDDGNGPDGLDNNPNNDGDLIDDNKDDKKDTDGDGVDDDNDECLIIFGSSDDSGCPVLLEKDECYNGPDINGGDIIPTNCRQCPCQFADFGGELKPEDTVRAILMDTGGNFEYTWSYPYKIIEE